VEAEGTPGRIIKAAKLFCYRVAVVNTCWVAEVKSEELSLLSSQSDYERESRSRVKRIGRYDCAWRSVITT